MTLTLRKIFALFLLLALSSAAQAKPLKKSYSSAVDLLVDYTNGFSREKLTKYFKTKNPQEVRDVITYMESRIGTEATVARIVASPSPVRLQS